MGWSGDSAEIHISVVINNISQYHAWEEQDLHRYTGQGRWIQLEYNSGIDFISYNLYLIAQNIHPRRASFRTMRNHITWF